MAFLPSGFVAQIFSGVLLACTYYVLVKSRLSKHLCRGLYLSVDLNAINIDFLLLKYDVTTLSSLPGNSEKKSGKKKHIFFGEFPDRNCHLWIQIVSQEIKAVLQWNAVSHRAQAGPKVPPATTR